MDRMPSTPDLNKERLEQLRALMPDLFTNDGTLNPDELKRLVDTDLVPESERFEFRWFGKADAKRNAFTPTLASLEYDPERSVNPELAEGNAIIEGENLQVLKCLLAAYRNRIKCIYIDPPYNKDKDFVYSDIWKVNRETYWEHIGVTSDGVKIDTNTKADGRFHSNWLNMIYPRLLLARQLLSSDGVIYVSIDDNEVHHLRRLCDEVFGEECRMAQFAWRTDGNFDNQAKIKECHEYVLMYVKNPEEFPHPPVIDPGIPDKSKLFLPEIRNTIVKNGPKNPPSDIPLPDGFPCEFEEGEIPARTDKWPQFSKAVTVKNGKVVGGATAYSGWSSKDLIDAFIAGGLNAVEDAKGQRTRFVLTSIGAIEVIKERSERQSHVISVLQGFGNTQSESARLDEAGVPFDGYPKPVKLIRYLVSMVAADDFTTLDFFAGSGTTAEAVMSLNAEQGGKRRFILVQFPELITEEKAAYKAGFKKISEITIARNRSVVTRLNAVADGLEEQTKEELLGIEDARPPLIRTGFRVYRIAKSRFPRTEFLADPQKTDDENLEALDAYIREKESAFLMTFESREIMEEVLLKNGFMLDVKTEVLLEFTDNVVFRAWDSCKEATICLDHDLKEQTIAMLKGTEGIFICLEQALNTTKKWNLKAAFGERLVAF